jgi:hypothetical protein
MTAITIYQPWASLIISGAKRFETRPWKHSYIGRLAIHAGAKRPFDTLNGFDIEIIFAMGRAFGLEETRIDTIIQFLDELPRGAVLGTTEHIGCRTIDRIEEMRYSPQETGCWDGGRWIDPTNDELLLGDWTPGRFAWEQTDPKKFDDPIRARGRQGLWNWESDAS